MPTSFASMLERTGRWRTCISLYVSSTFYRLSVSKTVHGEWTIKGDRSMTFDLLFFV